jgi:hypothetical protein
MLIYYFEKKVNECLKKRRLRQNENLFWKFKLHEFQGPKYIYAIAYATLH